MKALLKRKTGNKMNNTTDSVFEPQSQELKDVVAFLKTVKFRRRIIGGLDERSVWKKLDELNRLYDAAIRAERIRGDALLAEYKHAASNEINKRETTIERLRDTIAKTRSDSKPTSEHNNEEG